MPTEKVLVFVRHAHRDTSERELDNGLSKKGREQVHILLKQLQEKVLPESSVFLSSPKKRCVETLEPLAHFLKAKLEIKKGLDEQEGEEPQREFTARIEKFVEKISARPEGVIYLCSHGDVIPLAIEFLTGHSVNLEKGKAVILEWNRRWILK